MGWLNPFPCLWHSALPQMTVINQAIGCRAVTFRLARDYRSSRRSSPVVPKYTAWRQTHTSVNNLPRVVTWQRYGRESNPQPLNCKSDALTITPPHRTKSQSVHNTYMACCTEWRAMHAVRWLFNRPRDSIQANVRRSRVSVRDIHGVSIKGSLCLRL